MDNTGALGADTGLKWPPEFETFKKIPRLGRTVIITEKLDGTNAQLADWMRMQGHLQAVIPSKKGYHLITAPFNVQDVPAGMLAAAQANGNCFLHRDNPTNLYIPDGAD